MPFKVRVRGMAIEVLLTEAQNATESHAGKGLPEFLPVQTSSEKQVILRLVVSCNHFL